MIRVIVTGGAFNDYTVLTRQLESVLLSYDKDKAELVSGGIKGSCNLLIAHFADSHGYKLVSFPASRYKGETAEYVRNAEMADYASEKDGILVAFWDNKDPIVNHMIETAKGRGLTVYVFGYGN